MCFCKPRIRLMVKVSISQYFKNKYESPACLFFFCCIARVQKRNAFTRAWTWTLVVVRQCCNRELFRSDKPIARLSDHYFGRVCVFFSGWGADEMLMLGKCVSTSQKCADIGLWSSRLIWRHLSHSLTSGRRATSSQCRGSEGGL